MFMHKPFAWLICALALPLSATGLDALRLQLQKAAGPEPIKASVDFQTWNRRGDEKKPIISQGKASAWVESGAQGLKIVWSHDQVQQVLKEVRLRSEDPEKTTPTKEAMAALDAMTLQGYLDPTPSLLRHLDGAQVMEERPDTLDGKAVRLITLKLQPRMGTQEKKYVKELEATAKVWVDAEGSPLAADLHTKVRGKVLLLISFASEERDEYRFTRVNGRLVTLRHAQDSTHSGGGESGQSKHVAVLTYN